ncbi:MAG: CARDB domain-containing protein [Candidatus Bipolaricaulota bacterium]
MLGAGCRKTRARRASAAVAAAVAVAFVGTFVTIGADVSIEAIQISVVESSTTVDRAALGLDKAVVGDSVRVSARVQNEGSAAVGQFDVDFFFTEVISGEHGKLGTQVVSGLEAGEEKRPVIVFDTSTFSPGIYAFSAEADPRDELGDTNACDNAAPLGLCAGTAAERFDRYTLTLLREGKHISELQVRDAFPVCRMGRLQTSLTVDVYNVGTERLSGSDLAVWGYYRQGLNPPANEFAPLVTDATGNPVQLTKIASLGAPGDSGFIIITLNYDVLSRLFAPRSDVAEAGDVLGRANEVQLRLTVQPTGGAGTARDIFLPDAFQLSSYYSTVDLWTFPPREGCCEGTCTETSSVAVEPAVAGGVVFHVARGATGDVLHVLKVTTGEEKGSWPAPSGKTLTHPVATYDPETLSYHVYVGATDGKIYAFEGMDRDEGDFLISLWQSAATDVVDGATYLTLSDDKTKLIAGSEAGAFVIDVADGKTLRKISQHGEVTAAPTYVDATGALWIATDEVVRGILPSGSECSIDLQDRVTTDLVANGARTALFFGTQSGFIYAVGTSIGTSACTQLADLDPLRTTVGLAVASGEGEDDAILFITSDIGEMARVEYDHGRGFRDSTVSVRQLEPSAIAAAPALLLNADGDDAAVMFVSGLMRDGRTTRPVLQAWDADLEAYEKVTVWGTSVPFLFKPTEGGSPPSALLRPVVDGETYTLLVASSDGLLYAFDLSQFE